MIVFSVITKKEDDVVKIMNLILKQKYAQSVQLDHEVKHILNSKNELEIIKTPKLSFITKALLYSEIEDCLLTNFSEENLIVYSTPISQMNKEHSSVLRDFLKSA